jgi:hypothetical protein
MHTTTMERYVVAEESVWQVRCEHCGVVANNVETEELASFLVGLHRAGPLSYARTGRPTGRTHVMDCETNETLCGVMNQWSYSDPHPDLATCLTCWTAWDAQVETLSQHTAAPAINSRPHALRPVDRKDAPQIRVYRRLPR